MMPSKFTQSNRKFHKPTASHLRKNIRGEHWHSSSSRGQLRFLYLIFKIGLRIELIVLSILTRFFKNRILKLPGMSQP